MLLNLIYVYDIYLLYSYRVVVAARGRLVEMCSRPVGPSGPRGPDIGECEDKRGNIHIRV